MAQTIKIKRSTSSAQPSSALSAGELAYSFNSSKLFIGDGSNNDIIGGELFTNMLDHTAGTLTASSAIIVDSSSKIDKLLVDNIRIGNTDNQIDTDSGSLTIAPASNLIITHGGTIDLSGQANEVTILDNNTAAFEIKEGSTSYFKLQTTNSSEKIFLGKDTVIDGNGSSGGVTISDGIIDIRTGTGSVSKIKFYCESSNAHFQTLQASPHSASASNTLVLPSAGSNLISDTATQTLSNKTLTSPDINTPDIDGGAIDGAVIGANTRAAASVTTLNANSTITGASITDGTATLASGGLTGVTNFSVDNINANGNTVSTTNSNGDLVLSPNGTGTVTVPSGYKDRSGFGATSLVSKEYVDAVKVGLDFKDSVRVASTADVTISGPGAAIDGISLSSGDRVLLKNQSTASQNGIYSWNGAASAMTRTTDADASSEVTAGMFVFVEEGTANADQGFVLTTDGTITVGSTSLAFTQFSGAGQIVAGDAMSKSGNTLNVNDDNITLEVNSDALRLKGITATAVGDLVIGASGTNTGYTRLAKPGSNDALLTMGTAGTASWTTTLDGGTF
tara:strand:+ start:5235 stop:6926 length:1692 start_codon:yes stop_codon:yes gene_type:complete